MADPTASFVVVVGHDGCASGSGSSSYAFSLHHHCYFRGTNALPVLIPLRAPCSLIVLLSVGFILTFLLNNELENKENI
jgi:hypothetical protein